MEPKLIKLPKKVYVYSKRHQIVNYLFLMGYCQRRDENTYKCKCDKKVEVFLDCETGAIFGAFCETCGEDIYEPKPKPEPKYGLLLFLAWLLFTLIALLFAFFIGLYLGTFTL